MPSQPLPVILAMDDEPFRRRLEAVLNRIGKSPERVGPSYETYHLTPEQHANALILLDTGDDVARLVQMVNDLYRSPYHPGGSVFVVSIVSEEAFKPNQSLGGWLIDGHAAVFAVWMRGSQAETDLVNLVHYAEREYEAKPASPLPSYDELLIEVLAQPENADVLMNLAQRLMVWQDDHRMNREMRIALLRHAVRLRSDSAQAHLLYGKALGLHGEQTLAEQEIREALRLAPDMAEAHKELGSLLCFSRPHESLAELRTAIDTAPQSDAALQSRNIIASSRLEERQ